VAATMVCQLLSTGTLTAIDRSTKMVEAATRRNAVYVASGKAEFLIASLEDMNLGDRRFDLVFAVRVGLFHRDPVRAHSLLRPWLAPDARVCTFYDVPV
jgi:ubiquinone/menaquinone biosynthesis C-methylase UbiE